MVIPLIMFYDVSFQYSVRKIIVKLNEKEYIDFLLISNEFGLTVEEKIYEIISYYLIIERRRVKFSRKALSKLG